MRMRKILSTILAMSMVLTAVPLVASATTTPSQGSFTGITDSRNSYYSVANASQTFFIGSSTIKGYGQTHFWSATYNSDFSGTTVYGGNDNYFYYIKSSSLYKTSYSDSTLTWTNTLVAALPAALQNASLAITASTKYGILLISGTTAYTYKNGSFTQIASLPAAPLGKIYTTMSGNFVFYTSSGIYSYTGSAWNQTVTGYFSPGGASNFTVGFDGTCFYTICDNAYLEQSEIFDNYGNRTGWRIICFPERAMTQYNPITGASAGFSLLTARFSPAVATIGGGGMLIMGGIPINDASTYSTDMSNCEYFSIQMYTVTFNSNGGSSVDSQVISSGDTATAPTAPTKTGYTFAGWYTDSALTTAYNFSTAANRNMTLYAKWTSNSPITLNKSTYTCGEIMTVTFTGAQNAKDWIGINQSSSTAGTSIIWSYLNGSTTAPSTVQTDGTISINTSSLPNGTYYIHYSKNDGYTDYASTSFTVTGGINSNITLNKTTCTRGDIITLTFTGAVNTRDWICVNQNASAAGDSIMWYYLNGMTTVPTSVISSGTGIIDTSSLAAGTYYVYYCRNDGYTYYAKTSFTVTA